MSKFLTYEDRLCIARGLREHLTFGAIAKDLQRDRSTIAKEIKQYSTIAQTGSPYYSHNSCVHRKLCKLHGVCGDDCTRPSSHKCSICNKCNSNCQSYEEEICLSRFTPPYVCNGCEERMTCTLNKLIYDPEYADQASSKHISLSRTGFCTTEEDISRINALITPLIKQGQSIHHIYINHKDELMCSEKTLYSYINACLFDIRNIDLPRKVKYRPRYKKPEFKIDRTCRIERSYVDYQKFVANNPDVSVVQMDTVIGSQGGKVLLTIHFVNTSFMLAFLRNSNNSQSVIDIFDRIHETVGSTVFNKLFPVILTDNGSEFSNPKAIEQGGAHQRITKIFYCDPSSPHQKGACEVNHELIRRILPKGSSFDSLSQEDVQLMMNHINSYARKKLNNRTPYESFSFYYGEKVLSSLGCVPIAPNEVKLKPSLIKRNQ